MPAPINKINCHNGITSITLSPKAYRHHINHQILERKLATIKNQKLRLLTNLLKSSRLSSGIINNSKKPYGVRYSKKLATPNWTSDTPLT